MGRLFSYDNKVMQSVAKIVDIVIVSILWVALSLTVIGFGPACTAAYYATAKCIRRDRGNLFKEFWRGLKENFGPALLMGLLTLFFAASLFFFDFAEIANAVVNQQPMGGWRLAFSVLKFFLLFSLCLYLFPIQSRFRAKPIRIIVTSLLVMFRHIGFTLEMVAILTVILVTAVVYPSLAVFLPGIFFYLVSFPMEKVLMKMVSEAELDEPEGTDQWYLEK